MTVIIITAAAFATNWTMWAEYIDPQGAYTREEFDAMSIEQREELARTVIDSNDA